MIAQGARRRSAQRAYGGGRGQLRYAVAYRRKEAGYPSLRALNARNAERGWWRRVMDDRDLLGVKLLLLAAVLGLTAVLERLV
jgi:hypothetical protein